MSFRFQWKITEDAFRLLSDPYLGVLQSGRGFKSITIFPKLYFSYNYDTQQTTIMTTELNRSHLWMIEHLEGLSGTSIPPEEIGRLFTQCFVVVQECFRVAAEWWDERTTGSVCGVTFHLRLC